MPNNCAYTLRAMQAASLKTAAYQIITIMGGVK
jgi:hypothetical protein